MPLAPLLLYVSLLAPTSESPAELKVSVTKTVNRFMERVHLGPGLAPEVSVKFTPSLSEYTLRNNQISTVAWSQCPPPLQDFVSSWAKYTDGQMNGETLFQELFSWFLIPHEMAHFMQGRVGKLEGKIDRYESEFWANQVAIAFWTGEKGGSRRTERFIAAVDAILKKIPSPVPTGVNAKTYFTDNYEKLGTDPNAYGWYQLTLIHDAWQSRRGQTLDRLIKSIR